MAAGTKVCACAPIPLLPPLTFTGQSQVFDARGRRSHRCQPRRFFDGSLFHHHSDFCDCFPGVAGAPQGFQLPAADHLQGLILLASPTATVTFVMSKEMQGDADFAVAAISASTLFSAGTYLFWLMVTSGSLR